MTVSLSRAQRLAKLFPTAAQKKLSFGEVDIPFRVSGSNISILGYGNIAAVKKQFRLEGQALFPIPVNTRLPENEEDTEIIWGDLTPVVISASSFEESTIEPNGYDELQIQILTTYSRMNESYEKDPFLLPFLIENGLSTRAYPLLTITNSERVSAMQREVYHLPSHCEPDLKISKDSKSRITGIKTPVPQLNHLLGTDIDIEVEAKQQSFKEWLHKWGHIKKRIGIDRVIENMLDNRRQYIWSSPHGRGTVTGRAINDVFGTKSIPGMVSEMNMSENAGACGADFKAVFSNELSYLRFWHQDNRATLGTDLNFVPEISVQTEGINGVYLMPQTPVLPLHDSDQKRGELKQLALECKEIYDKRMLEVPLDERPPLLLTEKMKNTALRSGGSFHSGLRGGTFTM
eukprot:TRINITY_DN15561_c0_g1_i1.p1 TRINITY_DN15561_c0_g1~~TRINITY_DN15561_c0_g1_i1.p1  ORF type:complete len:403 (+),score=50.33 TRINITY_DN15561_c0_g1_i1:63-1271(+)